MESKTSVFNNHKSLFRRKLYIPSKRKPVNFYQEFKQHYSFLLEDFTIMHDPAIPHRSSADKVEVSVHLDSELLDQIKHLTNDPSKVIETAIRQWLRGDRREDELALTLRRNPPIPPRGEWND